ncbi:MAG: hypothetical protein JSW67_01040 [Candidatus Latescibacterota bacterium]|nr:MAG: hypothetical protein JSW67_01040 [Candidatus Latescibacterota bacterium]
MQALSEEEADADFASFDAEQLPPAKAEEAKNAIANMLRAEILKVRTVPILQVRFRGSWVSCGLQGPHSASPSDCRSLQDYNHVTRSALPQASKENVTTSGDTIPES